MDHGSTTEAISPRYSLIDTWPNGETLRALWEAQLAAVAAVGAALPAIECAAAAITLRMRRGGRLCYVGAGTSARIATQDGVELPPTFGWPEERLVIIVAGGADALLRGVENAEDDIAAASASVMNQALDAADAVIGVAASGRTPFTVTALTQARARGSLTIGIAGVANSPLLRAADHAISVETGAEPIAGSTRLKAGTAQKVVLNLLSTLVMTQLGHVHDGMMVDMLPRNAKLRGRGRDMLMRIAECDAAAAEAALSDTGGNVKRAALLLRGLRVEAADALLARHDGNLRAALQAIRP
jgi:N-acetylmuramic acid 6-phosphate etherase